MFICYLDESGTPEPGGTSHFILLGMALPVASWRRRDSDLDSIKVKHRLKDTEIHTAWMLRMYPEQERIAGFQAMPDTARRAAVLTERKADLAKASLRGHKAVKQLRTNYKKTEAYTHLTHAERKAAIDEIAAAVGSWTEAVFFADAQMKAADARSPQEKFAYAFEQLVSRFHYFLDAMGGHQSLGMLVQDNNETAAKHLTALMRQFHAQGTKWANIQRIIETPLFVDSALTGMVQVADLCSYATRRFFENNETALFDLIYPRFDRVPYSGKLVGLRHYTSKTACKCKVCVDHGR